MKGSWRRRSSTHLMVCNLSIAAATSSNALIAPCSPSGEVIRRLAASIRCWMSNDPCLSFVSVMYVPASCIRRMSVTHSRRGVGWSENFCIQIKHMQYLCDVAAKKMVGAAVEFVNAGWTQNIGFLDGDVQGTPRLMGARAAPPTSGRSTAQAARRLPR